ncbi:MAG: sugar phosphate isomerase/epimerase [Planctomycetales bacterium]|nr:sugar phosphate isomerase/epimerase [Planctomycetales bacterium]
MQLSLSVRIAEGFLSKEDAIMDLESLAKLASDAGYHSICMRASQVGVASSTEQQNAARNVLDAHGLKCSMVTGDFAVVYNNEQGPDCLRDITAYLDLADRLGAPMIRVALKKPDDIVWAQRAADEAKERDVRLVHQCHTLSLFETVDTIVATLQAIARDNFGLIYEPANLEICGQDYGYATIERIAPWLFNVYLQNQILKPDGEITLNTWCRGDVSFDIIQIHDAGGVDFATVFDALHMVNYDGTVTVHQSAPDGTPPHESATQTAAYLGTLITR